MIRIGLSFHNASAAYDNYATALERRAQALGIPVEIMWLAGRDRDLDIEALRSADGICLTGGADVDPAKYGRADASALCEVDPRRDAIEWEILEDLRRRDRPTLAICRGTQILNVFHGGTLIPDLGELNATHRPGNDEAHAVEIVPGTLLAGLSGSTAGDANSSHHQAVDRIAPGFRVSARALDGTIEAFERESGGVPFLLAVQWHPERMAAGERLADTVLDAFLHATAESIETDSAMFPVERR